MFIFAYSCSIFESVLLSEGRTVEIYHLECGEREKIPNVTVKMVNIDLEPIETGN